MWRLSVLPALEVSAYEIRLIIAAIESAHQSRREESGVGTDIIGWVEVQTPELGLWFGIVKVRWLVDRNYPLYGCLFGHRERCECEPLAPHRGIHESMSDEVRGDLDRVTPGATWVMWSELEGIVPSDEEGSSVGVTEHCGLRQAISASITPGWITLFQFMRILAGRYGADHVRLVVWFDS